MARFTYEIKQHLAVTVYDSTSGQSMPFLFQPFNPSDGHFWESEAEAQSWVEAYIASREESEEGTQ
jgi:hypothetical protein